MFGWGPDDFDDRRALAALRIVVAALLVAGIGVLAFELSFFALAASTRTRVFALLFGIAFHMATQLFMFIPPGADLPRNPLRSRPPPPAAYHRDRF